MRTTIAGVALTLLFLLVWKIWNLFRFSSDIKVKYEHLLCLVGQAKFQLSRKSFFFFLTYLKNRNISLSLSLNIK